MGGKVDAHGVGITSGLEKRTGMNQGGSVKQQATFGVGNNANKTIGPDGKVREAHGFFLPFLGLGAAGGAGAGITSTLGRILLPKALKALGQGVRQRSLGPLKKFINKGTDKIKYVLDPGNPAVPSKILSGAYSPVTSKVVGQTAPSALTKLYRGAQLAAPVGITGGVGGAGVGLTMAGFDRAGLLEEGNDDSFAESAARKIGKVGLTASIPGLATALTGAAFDTDKNPKRKMLYDILAGNQLKPKARVDTDTDIRSTAEREAEAYEEMKSDASRRAEMMYEALNGGVNKMAAISAGLAAATPYIANEQYAEGAAAFSQGIQPELQADEDLKKQIGAEVLGQIRSEKEQEDKYVSALIGSNDGVSAQQARRLFKIDKEVGLSNMQMASVTADGMMDVEEVGVYIDKDNATGKLYIAIPKENSTDAKGNIKTPRGFDDIDEAREYIKK